MNNNFCDLKSHDLQQIRFFTQQCDTDMQQCKSHKRYNYELKSHDLQPITFSIRVTWHTLLLSLHQWSAGWQSVSPGCWCSRWGHTCSAGHCTSPGSHRSPCTYSPLVCGQCHQRTTLHLPPESREAVCACVCVCVHACVSACVRACVCTNREITQSYMFLCNSW